MKLKLWLTLLAGLLIGIAVGYQSQMRLKLTNNLDSRVNSEQNLTPLAYAVRSKIIELKTLSRSYFALDYQGNLSGEIIENKKKPIPVDATYNFPRKINVDKTALIVMDPWEDNGSIQLNKYFGPIVKKKLVPLIKKAISIGMPVIVLTNAPDFPISHGSKLAPEVEELITQGKIRVFYHQSIDSKNFSIWLEKMSIDTLIYSGFASNMCIIGRDLGMISMKSKGFKLFFIPKASAAIEHADTWSNGTIHKSTTMIISQWIGELIDLDGFLSTQLQPLEP